MCLTVLREFCRGRNLARWIGIRWTRFPLVLLVFALAGCQGADLEDPDEHAHHHTPGHYPGTYAGAVRILRSRLDELAPRRPGPAVTAARLEQFADLLKWLPSLALETDMTREPWTRLSGSVSRAEEMVDRYREGLLAGTADAREQFHRALEPELALWEQLLEVATDHIFRPIDQNPSGLPVPATNASLTSP